MATVRPLERVVVWVMGWRETAVARLRRLNVAAVAGTLWARASRKDDCAKRRAAIATEAVRRRRFEVMEGGCDGEERGAMMFTRHLSEALLHNEARPPKKQKAQATHTPSANGDGLRTTIHYGITRRTRRKSPFPALNF